MSDSLAKPLRFDLPESLDRANAAFLQAHPGESGARQPVHSVYGGAHLFKFDTCRKLGQLAERSLAEHAPNPAIFAAATGIPHDLAEMVYARVLEKLLREPVEDFRVDFEDGFGIRPDAEEDAAAKSAAEETAKGIADGTLPPFFGIRIKPLNEELKSRSFQTLQLFLNTMLDRSGGKLPAHFAVTLPKITVPEQVSALAAALRPVPDIKIEIMVEAPESLFRLSELVDAGEGRCVAAHFGPFDYTSSVGISASRQSLLHPACEFARSVMQVTLAGRGLWLADGPTTVMPVGVHRGAGLSEAQKLENRAAVHHAWKMHYGNVNHALDRGFYQGWDLHPAQLPTRYAAVYAFFLEGLDAASERLRNFMSKAAQATMVGNVFDDAATGQGLLNYFLRAMNCGAIPESQVPSLTGLTLAQLRTGSFTKILKTL